MRLLTLFATTIALFGAVTPTASAQTAQCGDSLTHSTTLTANLVCADVGLVIAADGVVLDLGGHELKGKTVLQARNVRRTVVRNGTITGHAEYGLQLENTRRTMFTDVRINSGIDAKNAQNTVMRKVTQDVIFSLTHFTDQSSLSVEDSTIEAFALRCLTGTRCRFKGGSGRFGQYLVCDETSSLTFQGGRVSANWIGCGTFTVRDATLSAHQIASSGTVTITDSRSDGYTVYAKRLVARRNLFDRSGGGPLIMGLESGLISDNTFSNMDSAGLAVNLDTPLLGRLVVKDNTFSTNGLRPAVRDKGGNLINAGAHFYLPAGGDLVVKGNHAVDNTAYGIWAQPGTVVDGGGNTSTNNPLGCLGVVCSLVPPVRQHRNST